MRKQLALIAVLTVISQLAALLKVWFTARIFGVGAELDGYNLSLVFPTLISGVMAGVLQTGMFPVRAKLKAAGDVLALATFERSTLLLAALLGILVTALLLLGTPVIASQLTQSSSQPVRLALAFSFPLLTLLVTLNFVGDCCGFLLAMRNRFAIAAAAPVVNGLLGALLLALWPAGGLTNLVAGTLLGLTLQVALCLWGLKTTGFVLFGPVPSWATTQSHWGEMFSLGRWILPGVVFSNLVVALPTVWMAQYGDGAVSAFGYAYRLHSSVLQFLVIAGSSVILARLSDLVAQGNGVAVKDILVKASVVSVVFGLFGVFLIWALGAAALQWLFGGRFDAAAAARVSSHWLLLSLGLGLAMMGNVFAKLWQAQRRPRLISVVAGMSLITLYLAHWLTQGALHEYSLSVSFAAATLPVVLVGLWYVSTGRAALTLNN